MTRQSSREGRVLHHGVVCTEMYSQGIAELPAFDPRTNLLNVVIETPLGATVKLKYDERAGIFRAHKAMPLGFTFPFNFGFVPRTASGDGDPLDVLLLGTHAMSPDTVVFGKITSVLEAEQIEGKARKRNDRLIAVAWDSVTNGPMQPEIKQGKTLVRAIKEFFSKYNEAQGKRFRSLRFSSARRGLKIVRDAIKAR